MRAYLPRVNVVLALLAIDMTCPKTDKLLLINRIDQGKAHSLPYTALDKGEAWDDRDSVQAKWRTSIISRSDIVRRL